MRPVSYPSHRMPVLQFDSVSKVYPGPRKALEAVSFAVDAGEMAFVTGHSGAGKSTLLRLIHLAERPTRGTVLFDDRNLAGVRGGAIARHRRNIGVVFQNHQLLADRSVADNVALPLVLRGMKRVEIGKRVRSILERVGLGGRERALPGQLSAGEQQRVGIARAIVAEPALLIADEPTGNLDPRTAASVIALLRDTVKSRGATGVLVTHSRAAASIADRVLELTPEGLVPPAGTP